MFADPGLQVAGGLLLPRRCSLMALKIKQDAQVLGYKMFSDPLAVAVPVFLVVKRRR